MIPVLEARRLSIVLGRSEILEEVDFIAEQGQVHCLLGDNGAGKSTLIKILSGVLRPSAGEILVDGVRVSFASPRQALNAGIGTVHQDAGAIPLMSVSRNFFLGEEPRRGRWPFKRIDFAAADAVTLKTVQMMGLTRINDPKQLVGTMSGGERQALGMGRALHFGARVLILDEPTSSLGVKEVGIVLRMVKQAKDNGVAVIFITHNATHALSVGDRFTVLIHGRVAASFGRNEKTHEEVISLMAGGEELEALQADLERQSTDGDHPDSPGEIVEL